MLLCKISGKVGYEKEVYIFHLNFKMRLFLCLNKHCVHFIYNKMGQVCETSAFLITWI